MLLMRLNENERKKGNKLNQTRLVCTLVAVKMLTGNTMLHSMQSACVHSTKFMSKPCLFPFSQIRPDH